MNASFFFFKTGSCYIIIFFWGGGRQGPAQGSRAKCGPEQPGTWPTPDHKLAVFWLLDILWLVCGAPAQTTRSRAESCVGLAQGSTNATLHPGQRVWKLRGSGATRAVQPSREVAAITGSSAPTRQLCVYVCRQVCAVIKTCKFFYLLNLGLLFCKIIS